MKSISKFFLYSTFFFILFTISTKIAFANTCVWQNGGVDHNYSTAGNWSGCGGVKPTAADDVQISAAYDITFDGVTATPNLARSIDMTGYTSIATAGATSVITIGDATAGLSNIALNMPGGFTYAPNSASLINFVSTSATMQTVSINSGYTAGNLTFNSASNGNYAIIANLTVATISTITLTKGTLHTDGITDNAGLTHSWGQFASVAFGNSRSLFLGNSTINITFVSTGGGWFFTNPGKSLFAGTSTINMAAIRFLFTTDSSTYNNVVFNPNDSSFPSGSSFNGDTFNNFTVNGGAIKTAALSFTGNFTVTGVLTFSGNTATNRLMVGSNTLGTPRVITVSGATVSTNNVDIRDITFARTDAGGLDLTNVGTRLIGDAGGNSRTGGDGTVTFTTPATQTWSGTSGGNWSTNAWTSRVPLPQDDVNISSAFISAQTITLDMPRAGKNIDFSNASWSGTALTFTVNPTSTFYGSFTFKTGMTSGNANVSFVAEGRGNFIFTDNGVSTFFTLVISMIGGKLSFGSAYIGIRDMVINNGTLDANNFAVTVRSVTSTSGLTRALTLGTGLWSITNPGASWNMVSSGMTLTSTGSTINFTDTSAAAKPFVGGSFTYNNVNFNGDNNTIQGSNTFNGTLFISKTNKTLGVVLTAGTTQTFGASGIMTTDSDSSNKAILKSSSGSSNATVSKPGIGARISVNFLQLTRVAATQTNTFYAGTGSVDGGNNTNWIFTNPPPRGLVIKNSKFKIKNTKVKLRFR